MLNLDRRPSSMFLLGLAWSIIFSAGPDSTAETQTRQMSFQGTTRTYLVYRPDNVPADQKLPVVLAFHGGGGTARQMLRYSRLNRLADRHHFIAVYPEALQRHWNDGRYSLKFVDHDRQIDDVAWIRALLIELKGEAVDLDRIYAVGVSNGGMFVQRLAVELGGQLAAVASIIASLPERLRDQAPRAKISVLLMNGTNDPLVPYEGGPVTIRSLLGRRAQNLPLPSRGKVLSTDATVAYWKRHNGIHSEGKTTILPNSDPEDGCRVQKTVWAGEDGVSVVLYKIMGGGHGLPGRAQYLSKEKIGNICQDIDGMEEVWRFFADKKRTRASK